METVSTDTELDWMRDPEFMDAQRRLRDVEGIFEQRERERQLIWDCKFSDDIFSRARHRAEWPDAEQAAALAEAYVHQARTRLTAAEQAAKAKAQPVWDDQFRALWRTVESVITPLLDAARAWEQLEREATAKGLTIPTALPVQWGTTAIPLLREIGRKALQLDDK